MACLNIIRLTVLKAKPTVKKVFKYLFGHNDTTFPPRMSHEGQNILAIGRYVHSSILENYSNACLPLLTKSSKQKS